ncbi:MAG: DUF917 family protein [Bacillota bacterium]
MTRLDLNNELLEYLVIGGSFYGGGGGGSTEAGRTMGRQALSIGCPHMVALDDLPPDALLLTVSAVGAPAGEGAHAGPDEYVRAVRLFERFTGKKVGGFIANECGGLATVNGWVQSAATGLPVVDAPCNGRAHPTGAMGSMGLNRVKGYISEQVAVGGRGPDGSNLEVFIQGSVESASGLVRKAASQVGGLVAVARNPVPVSYASVNAAPGAIHRCLEVGRAIVDGRTRSAMEAISGAAAAAGGAVVCKGRIVHREIESVGGFDFGRLVVQDRDAPQTMVELYFCNEYLTVEKIGSGSAGFGNIGSGERLYTFPDLVTTLDLRTGLPVTSAEVRAEAEVAVVVVPRANLVLGAGMRDRDLYADVERLTGRELVRYVF